MKNTTMKDVAAGQTIKLSNAIVAQINKLLESTGSKGKEDFFSRCLGFKETDDRVKPSSAESLTTPSMLSERGLNEVVVDRLETYLAKIKEEDIKKIVDEILKLNKDLQKYISINKKNILDSLFLFYFYEGNFDDRIRADEILHDQDRVKCVLISSVLFLLYYYKDNLEADSECPSLEYLVTRIKKDYDHYKGLFPTVFMEEGFNMKENINYDTEAEAVRINREDTYLVYEQINNDNVLLKLLKSCLEQGLITTWNIYKDTECNRVVCDKYQPSYSVQPPTDIIRCDMANDSYKLSFIF